MSSPPCSNHHVPPRGQHTPAHGSHAPARASHAPPCPPRATARSFFANLLPPCPLLQPLLSGLFFFFLLFLFSLYCLFFVFLLFKFYVAVCFVFCGLPAMKWFDLEEEIDVGGRPLAPLWFSVVLALQLLFYSGGCFTRIGLFTEFLCNLHSLVPP
jgi:hypothetical protein